ncbi:MAG: CHAD domain-containing protein [Bacteroidetes bacterium]|nr:CHAD domain-containing protein [Bacteroidota bacterium]
MTIPDDQRRQLQDIAQSATADADARRNARLLLLYADGNQTRDVAREVGLSESRARFWRKIYERHGMQMFKKGFVPERRATAGATKVGSSENDPSVNDTVRDSGKIRHSGPLLTEEEAHRLRQLCDGAIGEGHQKRIHLILSYNAGKSTNEIAREIGLSPSRTRFWRKVFEREGMQMFTGLLERSPREETGKMKKSSKKRTPGLQPEDSFAGAARKVLRMYYREMLKQGESAQLGHDPEVVHGMRVATRRMRSAFDVFHDAFIPKAVKGHRRSLRRAGKILGRVRDLDVLIMHMREYAATLTEDDAAAFLPLIREWEAQREKALNALQTYLQSTEYHSFTTVFGAFLDAEDEGIAPDPIVIEGVPRKIGQIAPVLVLQRYMDIMAFDAQLERATLDQLHLLRIQFKKMRYTLEFFIDVLGDQARAAIREVTDAQDYLGKMQDDQTAMELITAFTHELDAGQSMRPLSERLNTAPLLTYLAERQSRKHHLLTSFGDTWAGFTGELFRRRMLRTLLHV